MFVECGRTQAEKHVIKGRKHMEKQPVQGKQVVPSWFAWLTAAAITAVIFSDLQGWSADKQEDFIRSSGTTIPPVAVHPTCSGKIVLV